MSVSKYSNDYKQKLINNGVYDNYLSYRKSCYLLFNKNKLIFHNYQATKLVDSFGCVSNAFIHSPIYIPDYLLIAQCLPNTSPIIYNDNDCCARLYESNKRKYCKVKSKIAEIVKSSEALFITLTFNNDLMAKTDALTRRRYVARYLKRYSTKYVANIDFGKENGREHYHAVVDRYLDLTAWHDNGAIDIEKIHNGDKDLKKVSHYVAKLTNHALKVKGVSSRLIYSRN